MTSLTCAGSGPAGLTDRPRGAAAGDPGAGDRTPFGRGSAPFEIRPTWALLNGTTTAPTRSDTTTRKTLRARLSMALLPVSGDRTVHSVADSSHGGGVGRS